MSVLLARKQTFHHGARHPYLDGLEDFDNSGVAKSPSFTDSITGNREARAILVCVEAEDATSRGILLPVRTLAAVLEVFNITAYSLRAIAQRPD